MIERERLPEDFTERVFEDIVNSYECVGKTRSEAVQEIFSGGAS